MIMSAKTFKRLPYGTSNFESFQVENYAYVDKTVFIEKLENEINKYQFFIRPRKFGKSLFLSMLSYYYDIRKKSQFERLFGDLYIGKHPTQGKNKYAVIEFDFSGIDTSGKDEFKVSFSRKVQETAISFLSAYSDFFTEAKFLIKKIDEKNPGIAAMDIVYRICKEANIKLFVIIDEYDHFANDLIAMGVNEVYKEMVRSNGVVRDFYETLKIGTKSVVDRIFITGISPVMIDDLTSGFNIAVNLTLEESYNNMMGFTEQEVEWLIDETGLDRGLINVDMKWYYNGYLFHKNAADRVYNPSMMLYFFYQIIKNKKVPEKIIDDNLKTDYGRLQRLTRNENNREMLIKIVKEGGIITEIQSKFSIDRLYDDDYFVSLLFYMGLLTIDKPLLGSSVQLCIPNYSIKTVYWEYIMKEVQISSDFALNTADLHSSMMSLDGKAKNLWQHIAKMLKSSCRITASQKS